MSTYDDEMYKFIAAKDNFDITADIYNLFPKVKERMIEEFWELLKEKIEDLDTDKKWKVGHEQKWGIWIYQDDWEVFIAAEGSGKSIIYGVYSDEELKDEDYGREILSKNRKVKWMENGKDDWFYFNDSGDNFQEHTTLKKIAIDNREIFVNDWANLLFDLANDTEKDLAKINKTRT